MKVGIAGTGKIVREFLNMQKDQERIEVTALVCRPQSEKTGRELAEQYGIPALYTGIRSCFSPSCWPGKSSTTPIRMPWRPF